MIRPVLMELALFATPFVLYALFLWMTRSGGIFARVNWPLSRVIWLLVAAFLLLIVSVIVMAQWDASPPRSTYTPAHVEDGKLVPGQTR